MMKSSSTERAGGRDSVSFFILITEGFHSKLFKTDHDVQSRRTVRDRERKRQMNTFYIVRHGKTRWNLEKRTQGTMDSPLLEQSIGEAKILGERLRRYNIDRVYSSDLKRAQDTAALLAPGCEIRTERGFREIGFGVWEGLTYEEILSFHRELLEQWKREPEEIVFPKGESVLSVQERVSKAFWDIDQREEGKNFLIVSHGITIRLLMVSLLGMPISGIFRIAQENLALNVIRTKDGRAEVLAMNDTAHLEEERRTADDNSR